MKKHNAIQTCSINKYNVYDISKKDDLVILVSSPYDQLNISLDNQHGELIHCPHNLSKVYLFKNKKDQLTFNINGKFHQAQPNTYPNVKDEIVFCAFVKNEDSYIRQWIDYHHRLGVDKFIIYDNSKSIDKDSYCSSEKFSDLESLLFDYIESKLVYLINWPYPKRVNGCVVGQVTQQNHTLYG